MTEIEIRASAISEAPVDATVASTKKKRRAAEPAPEQLLKILEGMFPECSKFLIKDLKRPEIKTPKSRSDFDKLVSRIERMAYQVALFQEDSGNTLLIWRPSMQKSDHHYADLEVCRAIGIDLFGNLLRAWPEHQLPSEVKDELRKLGFEFNSPLLCCHSSLLIDKNMIKKSIHGATRIGRAEIPVDYCSNSSKMHVVGNLRWIAMPDHIFQLREFFAIHDKLVDKIQTKAYLTDRRQTGDHSTNRECRWETNPASPQFATKRDSMEVEAKLLGQLFEFTNAPQLKSLQKNDLEAAIQSPFRGAASFRCPVSGQPIDYNDFVAKTNAGGRTHGRSKYQVGHLDPLAQRGSHSAGNISWVSELGNRVQGESSLEDIIKEIFRMAVFHKERAGISWESIESELKPM